MKRHYWIIMVFGLIVAAVVPGYLAAWPGTRVCGIDLGGLSITKQYLPLKKPFPGILARLKLWAQTEI